MPRTTDINITYLPSPGMTQERAHRLRAQALQYALDRFYEKRKAAGTSDGQNARKEKNGSGRSSIQPGN